jgi:O-acetyl-ADP-ribose deacetylase (regulator of RNase III)
MALHVILGAKNPELIKAWESEFVGLTDVTIRGGNILLAEADALVSPANSFGFMDGGFDWSISEMFEWKIQSMVQSVIRSKHSGELLVGDAEIVPTGNEQFPFLICAPTMRVPQNVADTVNAFLAMRATLLAINKFNKENAGTIRAVAIPGLCTGAGRMPYDRCARQMRAAYDLALGRSSNHYGSLSEAIADEKRYKIGSPDYVSRLQREIWQTEHFFRSLFQGGCPSWSNVLFVENMHEYYKNGMYRVPQAALLTREQYEPQFESLLDVCSWINFNVIGIFSDSLIINLEYPNPAGRNKHGKRDMVSVNLSGPCLKPLDDRLDDGEAGIRGKVQNVPGLGEMQPEWCLSNKVVLI